jgi:arabinogalactan endo-1,4-beta-galactosidase
MKKYALFLFAFLPIMLVAQATMKVWANDTVTEFDTRSIDSITFVDLYPDPIVGSYAYGADCSWISEQENDGVLFYDSLGQATDGMRVMRDAGMNSVRLRIWVNHTTGWCNKEDVIVKAKRAAALKLRVMIDFHYSDFFADPSRQNIPVEWADYNLAQMKQAVANHTTEVLSALKAEGVTPEWIQVGNETRNGMLWPMGQLWNSNGDLPNGWKNYAALTTAGYDACKAIFPDASVIVHIDNAYENNNWFFRKLKQNGGKFDMIGLSHYPMMKQWSGKDWDEMNELAAANIRLLHNEFKCPVMVVEIGTMASSVSKAAEVIADFRQRVDTLDYMQGIFYWEPQVYNNWRPKEYIELGWGAYNMGAFTSSGQPNEALKTLWKR